jgi:membrane protease YdiL (CAAX protease family)
MNSLEHHIFVGIICFVIPIYYKLYWLPSARKIRHKRNQGTLYWRIHLLPLAQTVIALLLWYSVNGEISSMGFQVKSDMGMEAALFFAIFIIFTMWFIYFDDSSDKDKFVKIRAYLKPIQRYLPIRSKQLKRYIPIVIIYAIIEEIFFRGYLIGYLRIFFNPGIALLLSSVIFAFAHLYQGWKHMSLIVIPGLIFGSIYLMSDSLLLPIVVHWSFNFNIIAISIKVNKNSNLANELNGPSPGAIAQKAS